MGVGGFWWGEADWRMEGIQDCGLTSRGLMYISRCVCQGAMVWAFGDKEIARRFCVQTIMTILFLIVNIPSQAVVF